MIKPIFIRFEFEKGTRLSGHEWEQLKKEISKLHQKIKFVKALKIELDADSEKK